MMSLRTPVTPFTARARFSARSRSAQDFANPESHRASWVKGRAGGAAIGLPAVNREGRASGRMRPP